MSNKGHVPIRMCVGCRKRKNKEEMVRLGHGAEGMAFISEKKDLRGRGFYLCPDQTCFEMAQKKHRMGRFAGIGSSLASLDTKLLQPMKRSAE